LYLFLSQKARASPNNSARAICEKFCARKRRKSAGILPDFKILQRIYGAKVPQSAAGDIVR
jgi:hypothetical protein